MKSKEHTDENDDTNKNTREIQININDIQKE